MVLFVLEDKVAKPNTETLLIPEFQIVWNRDTTIHKDIALKEFTFIEFMCSPRKTNPYAGYDDATRLVKLKEALFKDYPEWTPDTAIYDCMVMYKDFFFTASPYLSLLQSAKKAAKELEMFFNSIDLQERNRSGMPVYKPKELTSALADTLNVIKNLEETDKKVQEQLFDSSKKKSGREINDYER